MEEAKKRKIDINMDVNAGNVVHRDETDELYEEVNRAVMLAEQANKKAAEALLRFKNVVKDELSSIAFNNLNTCVESCQDARQLINESRSRQNETGMLDLSDDAMLCLMEFLPLSDILKLRLLSKSVYTFVTNLCGYCKLLKIYLPDTFISSSGSQFHPQTTDYFLNSTKDVKIMFTRKMATFQEESIDLLDKCAHRVISIEDDGSEMFGVVPALVWKKFTRLEDLNVSYIDEDGAKNIISN